MPEFFLLGIQELGQPGTYLFKIKPFKRLAIAERAAVARARGHLGGRPRALTPEKLSTTQALMRDPSISVSQVCRTVGVSRQTLYRHLAPDGSLRREAKA